MARNCNWNFGCGEAGVAKSRSLTASRARHTAAGKKKRGIAFGMTAVGLFP
jgi:hypothetical protein